MASGKFPGHYRVTEVLEKYSGLGDISPEVLQAAADRGTRVHSYCELYAKGMLFQEVDEDCKLYVQSFIEWFDYTVEEVISVEERFFCDELQITGQVDLIAVVKGDDKPSVIDFKTPQVASKTWVLQLAAYFWLAREYGIERAFALQLPKKGGAAKIVEDQDQAKHFYIYKGLLEAHKYFYPI